LNEKGEPADTRTPAQKAALWSLLKELTEEYPDARIVGHNELPHVAKACPCFSCASEYFALQPENRKP
jgi:N-acetyl-anhydromuramyl-L-alanine amidase AmpD